MPIIYAIMQIGIDDKKTMLIYPPRRYEGRKEIYVENHTGNQYRAARVGGNAGLFVAYF